jgi:hypothetical protein
MLIPIFEKKQISQFKLGLYLKAQVLLKQLDINKIYYPNSKFKRNNIWIVWV